MAQKMSEAFSRPVSRWVPDTLQACCLLLSSLLIWDRGLHSYHGAVLQYFLESLQSSGSYQSQMSYEQKQGLSCVQFCLFLWVPALVMHSGHPVLCLSLILEPNRPKEAVSELPIIPTTALLCPLPSIPHFTPSSSPSSSVSFLRQSADKGMALSQTPTGRLTLTR